MPSREVEFPVKEQSDDRQFPDREVKIKIKSEGSVVCIAPEGYNDCNSLPGHGSVAMFELWEGHLRLIVWSDINQEDPTHIIDLEEAKEEKRKEQ